MEKGEIILYQPNETIKLEVRIEEESVWLTRQQLAILFNRDVKTIGKHINNALREELDEIPVVAKFATTASDGKCYNTEHYNLDMILSVGYRVKSNRGIEFRRWANKVLKDYLLKGYSLNQRLQALERTVAEHSQKIDFFVRTSLPPVEGIFYNGQIFDAYKFATDLIKSAKHSLVLIDNYVDETTLLMLSKRSKGVSATIYTAKISKQAQRPISTHTGQNLQGKPRPFLIDRRNGSVPHRCIHQGFGKEDVCFLQNERTCQLFHETVEGISAVIPSTIPTPSLHFHLPH